MSEASQERILLFDTTLRDGTQGEGVWFSVEDKLRLTLELDRFGIDYVEGGWPGSNPKDAAFFERAASLPLRHARLVAFGSTRRAGRRAEEDENLQAIRQAGVRACAIFGKSWDLHVREALRTTPEENLRMIRDSVAYLLAQGLEVIYDAEHFFDGYKASPHYALRTLEAAIEAGAACVTLCDTNGGTLPSEVERITREVVAATGLGGPGRPRLGIHAHNDAGLAVANTLAAVGAGAMLVQGTINGYGERCGNADLVQVIPNLELKMGRRCLPEPAQLERLSYLSRFVSEMANIPPDERRPFVGRAAFAHKGGVHVSAMLRHPKTYEHIDPSRVGNTRRVLVSELSGASNVLYKAQALGIPLEPGSPVLRQVVEQVKALENEGYHFEAAEGSLELLLRRAAGERRPPFELEGFRLIIEGNGGAAGEGTEAVAAASRSQQMRAEATVKLRVQGRVVHTAADGNGPVNALDTALRKALETAYPELAHLRLVDYKVRVLDEAAGTAARVRVLITSRDEATGVSWSTIGVSTNIIEASWKALSDSIEYGLLSCRQSLSQAPAV